MVPVCILSRYLCFHLFVVMLFQGATGWMGDPDVPLKGFPWKGGAERDTSGILMWSEPFEVVLPGGEKVGVVVQLEQFIAVSVFY